MNALTTQTAAPSGKTLSVFSNSESFEAAQRIAKALVSSDLVPVAYRGNEKMGNALIAMDMANRMGIAPMMVMQNMHIIEGRPSWASSFIIGALNSCGLFSPIRFKIEKGGTQEVTFSEWEGPKGDRKKVTKKATVPAMTCVAYAIEKETGEVLEGPEVSIAMAVAEGWYFRAGSKWPTMSDLLIRYRAAAFFGRLYAPHILNGMPTDDEVLDVPAMRDVTPVSDAAAAPSAEASPDPKPAGRPKGVHDALKRGKAEPAKPAKAEPPVIDAEAEDITDADGEGDEAAASDAESGDVFGAPDDDEYEAI